MQKIIVTAEIKSFHDLYFSFSFFTFIFWFDHSGGINLKSYYFGALAWRW